MKRTPEGYVKKAVEDLLTAEKIPYWRMNAGDRFGQTNGRKWRIRGHAEGTADILAAPRTVTFLPPNLTMDANVFLWIETKGKDGKQSAEQLEFADYVRNRGHYYLVIEDVKTLQDWLKEHRAR